MTPVRTRSEAPYVARTGGGDRSPPASKKSRLRVVIQITNSNSMIPAFSSIGEEKTAVSSEQNDRAVRFFSKEIPISIARSIFLIVKVVFLVLITLGFALLSQSLREDWKNAFRRTEFRHIPFVEGTNPGFEVPRENFYAPRYCEDIYAFRASIFQDTKRAYEKGYLLNGKSVEINNRLMLEGTEVYEQLELLPFLNHPFPTRFSVEKDDTLNVLLNLKAEGRCPVGINMAHAYKRGGGVKDGCPAQEEALSRRSNYIAIEHHPQASRAWLNEGGIYSPHVTVFRDDDTKGYAFMENPKAVAIVAVAAFDLRIQSQDRIRLGLSAKASYTEQQLRMHPDFVNGTKKRIRNMLRKVAEHGHTDIVLGALGCGAFQNPPKLIAALFEEVFGEKEFKGRFKRVIFAVLQQRPQDAANVDAFREACERLNS